MTTSTPVVSTTLDYPRRQGKVRDVYDLGDQLLIVSTDRISAFDWVLPNGIPSKGVVLTQLSRFWFNQLSVDNHMISTELPTTGEWDDAARENLAGRIMFTKKAEVIPFECVVRGYLEGSGWREYQDHGQVCGIALPGGLRQCDRLAEPIFTPATKATSGHDMNVSFEFMVNALGADVANQMRDLSLQVYNQGSLLASERGILIADTKFEWGWHDGKLILIDEVLTPDSSRFWPANDYRPGQAQPSFDKQFVREWLMQSGWDRNSPPPVLPDDVVQQTSDKYLKAFEMLTGHALTSGG
ncbi:MAG: phosphoribosylaminoimidazolesuccinocarboxamide synthase [Planctomycetales bacterium]|nr:phosphoribosylaminoimidazolesuccinocarboxamide synthase [Planctomycetales bacterium]